MSLLKSPFAANIAAAIIALSATLHISGLRAQTVIDLESPTAHFLRLVIDDTEGRTYALERVDVEWEESFLPMALDALDLMRDPRTAAALIEVMKVHTGKDFQYDINAWYQWYWSKVPTLPPDYAAFKAILYGVIDPKFRTYFASDAQPRIRLDEVRWGGPRCYRSREPDRPLFTARYR